MVVVYVKNNYLSILQLIYCNQNCLKLKYFSAFSVEYIVFDVKLEYNFYLNKDVIDNLNLCIR